MAIGPHSQIIVISGTSTTGCRYLDIYSCKGTYERSISVVTTADKCELRNTEINTFYTYLLFSYLYSKLFLALQSYSALATCNNFILATRRHYNSYVIDLIDMNTEKLINTVDSNSCKLRRPAGMVAFTELQDASTDDTQLSQCSSYYLLVTDVAADSVNKYQYF